MKLLGYVRNHGTSKKTGKDFDFVKLLLQKDEVREGSENGGIVWCISRRTYDLPTVDTDVFLKALKAGIHVGDEIELLRDVDDNVVIKKL